MVTINRLRTSDGFTPVHRPPSFAPVPPQFRGHPWFFAKITQISDFFAFPNFRKVGKFAASIKRPKTKSVSASGGVSPPDPLTRGSAPGPRWELRPQTPVIGTRYRARYGAVPPKYWGGSGPDLAGERLGAPGGWPGPSGVFGISERDWLSNYRVLKIEWETPCWWEAWGPGPPGPLNPALGARTATATDICKCPV